MTDLNPSFRRWNPVVLSLSVEFTKWCRDAGDARGEEVWRAGCSCVDQQCSFYVENAPIMMFSYLTFYAFSEKSTTLYRGWIVRGWSPYPNCYLRRLHLRSLYPPPLPSSHRPFPCSTSTIHAPPAGYASLVMMALVLCVMRSCWTIAMLNLLQTRSKTTVR